MGKVRISELPYLVSASADVILPVVDNGVTYKTDLNVLETAMVHVLSSSIDNRLDFLETFSASFPQFSSSIDIKIEAATNEQSLAHLITTSSFNSFTQSYYNVSASFDSRIQNHISSTAYISESYTEFVYSYHSESSSFSSRIDAATNEQYIAGLLLTASYNTDSTSFDSRLDGLESFSSSADNRYVLSGSITQTTWDNIANKPNDIISSSTQISDLGFVTGSYTTITSFNNLTQSFNQISQSFTTVSGSFGEIDFSGINSITASYLEFTQSYYSESASFDSRIISGSAVAGTISGSSQIAALGYATTSSVTTISASAWGAFQSASSYSSSLQTSITTLSSSVNTLSSSVDSRFDTLEATIISGSPNYIQVLGNQRSGISVDGTSIISGSITTTGNPVQIMVTGDANPTSTTGQWCRLQLYRNSSAIGNIIQVESSAQNENVPYCLNVIDTPSAGTYEYSLKIASPQGTWAFGEATGPLLTAVELKTNTNLPSTNNTFTETNTFTGATNLSGSVRIGAGAGFEGGELQLAYAPSGSTLTGSAVSVDIYQNRLRIFEGGGNARGAHLDLSKLPEGVAGELIWKTSGFVNAGTFLTLDNLKVSVTTGGSRGLSVGAVSTNFTANISGWFGYTGGGGGASAYNVSYTTTGSNSAFGWSFGTEGDGSNYIINDKTNNRVYRVSLMIGAGYNNNFISIERLY
jgi:hypothetical protein